MKKLLFSAALFAVSFTTVAQVGVGTTTPEAALDIVSTNSGVLLPRVANAASVATPVNGMLVYDVSEECFRGYANGSWTACGIKEGTIIKDLISSSGRRWMDRNLGATQVAASSTDADSYGDLYQWGRDSDGHESRTSNTTATIATTADAGHGDFILGGSGLAGSATDYNWTDFTAENDLWQAGLNDPCPSGYRIPTETELQNEVDQFSTNDADGAFSALKLPLAGYRYYSNGTFNDVGSNGYYWSSTVSSARARYLIFYSSEANIYYDVRADGFSVRCIKE
jgi:hypothetical protein